jgi:hypothetical protein
MHHKILLCLLLPIPTVHAMENIANDIIVYDIGYHLNRPARTALSRTNKRHSQIIMSQYRLNTEYAKAYEANDIPTMLELRKKGALHYYEEIYKLFVDNQKNVAKSIWLNHDCKLVAFCIKSAFTHGITLNNKEFVLWLLEIEKPLYNGNLITNAIKLANELEHTEITQKLAWYIAQKKAPVHISYDYQGYHDPMLPYPGFFP